MTEIENRHQPLIDRIYDAFSDVPYPGDNHVWGPQNSFHLQTCGECRWLSNTLVGKTWQEAIKDEAVHGALTHAMSYYEPAAWLYYLPAYLIHNLKRQIYVSLYFRQTLDPGLAEWQAQRIDQLTELQCRMILAYLSIVVRENKQSSFNQQNRETLIFWERKYDEIVARLNDVPDMIIALRQNWQGSEAELERQLHRYYLACCRAIWRFLPQKRSQTGIEVAEQYVEGLATDEDLLKVDRDLEGAAFNIDYNCDPEAIRHWIEEIRVIPREELQQLIYPPQAVIMPRQLLLRAAYFAVFAVNYPHLTPKDPPPVGYTPFLSPAIFREIFGEQK